MVLSYLHEFHAGNIGDVFKHIILGITVRAETRRASRVVYIESHGGSGLYDLRSVNAMKRSQDRVGLQRLLRRYPGIPEQSGKILLEPFIHSLRRFQNTGEDLSNIRYYPGSPLIAAHNLNSASDEMILCELHPKECNKLNSTIQLAKPLSVEVRQEDGFEFLKAAARGDACLPQGVTQGCVTLIDPPYESVSEYQKIAQALYHAVCAYPQGCHLLWYPVLNAETNETVRRKVVAMERAHRAIQRSLIGHRILKAEIHVSPQPARTRSPSEPTEPTEPTEPKTRRERRAQRKKGPFTSMRGCGVVVVNPPEEVSGMVKTSGSGLKETSLMSFLEDSLEAKCTIEWIV